MTEESQTSEAFIKEIFEESGIAKPQEDEERISKIISQTRRNVGTRDFILLTFVRFWLVLTEIVCKIFARQAKNTDYKPKKSP